jgi:hypothetical protein
LLKNVVQHVAEVRRSKSRNGIISLNSLVSIQTAISSVAVVVSVCDIIESSRILGKHLIEQWVQESKLSLSSCKELVIDQRDQTSESWGTAGCSINSGGWARAVIRSVIGDKDEVVMSVEGDIRVSSELSVVGEAWRKRGSILSNVVAHDGLLVRWLKYVLDSEWKIRSLSKIVFTVKTLSSIQ